MKALLALLVFALGCGHQAADRAQQLTNCRAVGSSGEEVRRCLVFKYDWNADSAVPAGRFYQRMLDSLEREHQLQVALVLARAEADSADSAQQQRARWTARWRLQQRGRTRADSCIRAEPIAFGKADSVIAACERRYLLH